MSKSLAIVGSLILAALVVGGFANNLETTARLLSAASPIVTVCLALFALHVWRVQLVMKRRFEVAEEALKVSQEIVYALSEIRGLWGPTGEGGTRKRKPTETKDESERLDHAFVPFERLSHYDGLFATMSKSVILVEIHLGPELAKQMRNLLGVRMTIWLAARSVARLSSKVIPNEEDQRRINEGDAILYETKTTDDEDPSNNDVLSPQIAAYFAAIEAECRRYLSTPRFKDSLDIWIP